MAATLRQQNEDMNAVQHTQQLGIRTARAVKLQEDAKKAAKAQLSAPNAKKGKADHDAALQAQQAVGKTAAGTATKATNNHFQIGSSLLQQNNDGTITLSTTHESGQAICKILEVKADEFAKREGEGYSVKTKTEDNANHKAQQTIHLTIYLDGQQLSSNHDVSNRFYTEMQSVLTSVMDALARNPRVLAGVIDTVEELTGNAGLLSRFSDIFNGNTNQGNNPFDIPTMRSFGRS